PQGPRQDPKRRPRLHGARGEGARDRPDRAEDPRGRVPFVRIPAPLGTDPPGRPRVHRLNVRSMSEPAQGASTDEDAARRERVQVLLRRASDTDGFVPFDRFMEVALYGEGVGFYTREGSPFGPEGDYYTAAHASPLFGRTIAERVRSVVAETPPGPPFRVLEIGPGDGTLGEGVLNGLAQDRAVAERVEYVLVDRSPALSVRAYERVSTAGRSLGIPVTAAGGVGADGPFQGVVLANEVLDAQPARRLLWDGERWQEVGVRLTH